MEYGMICAKNDTSIRVFGGILADLCSWSN